MSVKVIIGRYLVLRQGAKAGLAMRSWPAAPLGERESDPPAGGEGPSDAPESRGSL